MVSSLSEPSVDAGAGAAAYCSAMRPDRSLFDTADDAAEQRADARAEESARAGRVISHGAVKRWLQSWGSAKPLPRPRVGD